MSSSRVKPGDVLGGKYRVEKILGAGGMGIVVSARHVELNQRVALKFMLKEAMADAAHAERFLREARAAVQLKSGHTAKVIDVGKLANGEPFMVMEYLEGQDLDAELHQRGPLPALVAVDYIVQVCEALAEAHGLGMVHRDVKLKNLFLTKTIDGRPLVKVLDFGLAKTTGNAGDVSLTAVNSVFGSPQYMSPEQMRSAKDVDHRSDIWSVGICLYELLAGRVPYDASGVAEICAMVLKDPVPPPSQFVAGLPADLEAVVMRCLEKDVTRRFQSIAEIAFALQGYASDEGSARRILTVMQSVQKQSGLKTDRATLVNVDPPGIDAAGKTLNAWDSGGGAKTRSSLSQGQIVLVVALSVIMALSGLALALLFLRHRASATTTPLVQAADPTPAESTPPPPEVTLPPPATATATAPPPAETVAAPTEPPPPDMTTAPPDTNPGTRPRVPVIAPPPPTTRPAGRPTPASSGKKSAKPGGGADYM